jgi:hypothetical protein
MKTGLLLLGFIVANIHFAEAGEVCYQQMTRGAK